MPWFMVDDGFHGHPKVVELDLADVGLWTLSGSWASHYLTDGRISMKTIHRFGATRDMADNLVAAELWLPLEGDAKYDYEFKDWADYQRLREVVLAEREAARLRMEKVRAAKKGVRANDTPDVRANNSRTTPERSGEVRSAPALPSPSLPIPSQPTPTDVGVEAPQTAPAATKNKRRTRIPDPFEVTPEMVEWAQKRVPGLDGRLSTERFINHFTAVGGAKGLMADWTAAWRNWLLADYDRGQNMLPNASRPVTGRQTSAAERREAENVDVVRRLAEREAAQNRQEISS